MSRKGDSGIKKGSKRGGGKELAQTKAELAQAKAELEKSQAELEKLRTDYEQLEADYGDLMERINQVNEQIMDGTSTSNSRVNFSANSHNPSLADPKLAVPTQENFKAAYDEIHKFWDFPRVPDLRAKLNWPRDVFDDMVRKLRNDMTIQLGQADQSLMTRDEIMDCFVDENNTKMGLLTWN